MNCLTVYRSDFTCGRVFVIKYNVYIPVLKKLHPPNPCEIKILIFTAHSYANICEFDVPLPTYLHLSCTVRFVFL